MQPAELSEWAAPIVVVKKKDGGIRICADVKMTINPNLRHKTFPLSTPDFFCCNISKWGVFYQARFS